MNSRSSSFSVHRPPPPRRPSILNRSRSRRLSSFSHAELGQDGAAAGSAEHEITEEIAEIKRYEDFTTIDWVQDAAREQLRRRARRKEHAGFFARKGRFGVRYKVWEAYDAGQAWIVVTIVGASIGLNAAFLNIITEWLSDIKLGYCTTAFYLNEDFCCWGAEGGQFIYRIPFLQCLYQLGCAEWHRWSSLSLINYILYFIFSVCQHCHLNDSSD